MCVHVLHMCADAEEWLPMADPFLTRIGTLLWL